MKVFNPYLLIENCHMDVVKAGIRHHQYGNEEQDQLEEAYEVPSPEDFGVNSFDELEIPEPEFGDIVEVEKVLTWSIFMKSQEKIFLQLDQSISFDIATAMLRDFSYKAAAYRKGKVTLVMKIGENDLVPIQLRGKMATICFAEEELLAMREDAETTYNHFPIVLLEDGTRYAVNLYPTMVARLKPDGHVKSSYQFSDYPKVETGQMITVFEPDVSYVMGELKY